MAGDWIKAYRSMMDSAVWHDEWLVKLWLWCLFKANHRDGIYKGTQVLRGQFVTGRNTAADELGVSPSKWYRGMQRLVEIGNIVLVANSEWTMVTVCNYTTYQHGNVHERTTIEQRADSERTASDTTSGQPADTIEEGKKGRREERKKTNKANAIALPVELDRNGMSEAWADWCRYRDERKKPITPTTAKKQFAFLLSQPPEHRVEIIETAIRNTWQGLFPLNQPNGQAKPAPDPNWEGIEDLKGIPFCNLSEKDQERFLDFERKRNAHIWNG